MIKEAKLKNITELFSLDKNFVYTIPRYQREYVWGKKNWETFFDDIIYNENGHFLGAIICINVENDSLKSPQFELVDGQQRMITISLLYLAIYHLLDHKQGNKSLKLKDRITVLGENNNFKLRLSPSYTNDNYKDYNYLFCDIISDLPSVPMPKYYGNRRIAKAFNYFLDRLKSVIEENHSIVASKTKDGFIIDLKNKLETANIVKIDVDKYDHAFTLFETLNNRGTPLSAIDIIKNKLLQKLEENKIDNITDNSNKWDQILKYLQNDHKIQERFLRQFYNAFKVDDEVKINIAKATRSNVTDTFYTLIDRDVNFIFNKLFYAAEKYNKFLDYNDHDYSLECKTNLKMLDHVNGVDSYMLLMFLDSKFNLSDKDISDLTKLLYKFSLRRNVTDTPPTRDITNRFIEIIENVNTLQNYSFEAVRDVVIKYGKPASDDLFREKLSGNLYEDNTNAARFILVSIENEKSSTLEKKTDFYERNKRKYLWTVEHILPQNPKLSEDWVNMLAPENLDLAQDIQARVIHKLGNLTLTGYNSSLSDRNLSYKQNKKIDNKYVGFKNGLWLNKDIANAAIWNEKIINERTNLLVMEALKIFKL